MKSIPENFKLSDQTIRLSSGAQLASPCRLSRSVGWRGWDQPNGVLQGRHAHVARVHFARGHADVEQVLARGRCVRHRLDDKAAEPAKRVSAAHCKKARWLFDEKKPLTFHEIPMESLDTLSQQRGALFVAYLRQNASRTYEKTKHWERRLKRAHL